MKRLAMALVAAALISCGPQPPIKPIVPVVIPAKVAPRPVCTDRGGTMGWIIELRISGQYLVREFYASGGYADRSDAIHRAPFPADPNSLYVIVRVLPWRLVYIDTKGVKHYVSDPITTPPPTCII